jgi:hypothetical protein
MHRRRPCHGTEPRCGVQGPRPARARKPPRSSPLERFATTRVPCPPSLLAVFGFASKKKKYVLKISKKSLMSLVVSSKQAAQPGGCRLVGGDVNDASGLTASAAEVPTLHTTSKHATCLAVTPRLSGNPGSSRQVTPAVRHDLCDHLPLISILRLPEPSPRSSSPFQQSAFHPLSDDVVYWYLIQ